MSEQTPEAKIETPAAEAASDKVETSELTDKDLDKAAGGLWPFVNTGSTYNKTI